MRATEEAMLKRINSVKMVSGGWDEKHVLIHDRLNDM
jgi:hypothetical protein